jgi:hypothetical protein
MNSAAQRTETSVKDCNEAKNCHFNKFRRPLYYHGMLIDEKGFRDEQDYHAWKRRLINRLVHGSGVVCGFELKKLDDRSFAVGCGLALDCEGWEIYVPCDVTIGVPQPSIDKTGCPPPDPGKEICYRIRLAFTEDDTDYQQLQLPGGTCGDKTCKPSRKREGFCVDLHACDCLPQRTPFSCNDPIPNIDYVRCSCGCDCSCGKEHWVSIGTVRVTDGKISGGPTYECRDYVISGQMLKQIFTKPDAKNEVCACPDQFERLKEILLLICKTRVSGEKLDQQVRSHLADESGRRIEQISELHEKFDAGAKRVQEVEQKIFKRLDELQQGRGVAVHDHIIKRLEAVEGALLNPRSARKKNIKAEEPPKA